MEPALAAVAVASLAVATWCELRRRALARRLAAATPTDPADAAAAAARATAWLEHLAWVTAVQARTPTRRALDDLLTLRSTRVEVLDVGERHLLDGAVASTEQALQLHDALHAWATASTVEATCEPVAVRAALDAAVAALDDDGRATLDVHTLPTVRGDADLLASALHAVLDNCVRYRWPGQPVHVTVTAEQGPGSTHALRIADDGLGVDVDAQDHLFLPFTRGNGASAMPGVGLGLAAVARAVEAMDGSARFVEHEGRGATIELTLPAA